MTDEPLVWTYWEGPCPDYIQVCLETIRRWCNVRVLGRDDFEVLWREDRDLSIDRLYVAHRADFIRAYLVHHYGGAWIDADCIVLRPIAPLADSLTTHDLIYYREPAGSIASNFFIANAGTPVTRSYYEAVVAHLRAQLPINWLEIGSVPLTSAIEMHPTFAHLLRTEAIMPISWTDSQRFLDPVPREALEDATRGGGGLHNHSAFCYMLSNHSMPAAIKTMSRSEILSTPIFLSYLINMALSGDSLAVAPNYRYWRQAGNGWASEYDRRKTRHPYYHIQEMMISDYIAHHTPSRILEWGCGTGRHLRNLLQIPNVEVFGFDQSETMLFADLTWASVDWRTSHLVVGDPTGPLPYPDAYFDIVFTCEALLHTRPDDLRQRLAEMVRVCRGHILHMESPASWNGYSPSCDGSWGHDLVSAYRDIGCECESLASGLSRQTPYLIVVNRDSVRWVWHPVMLSLYHRLETLLEEGFAQAGVPRYA